MTGMPNITLSASSPPTPQASTPMPLIIGVWLSVPISVSGTAQATPSRSSVVDDRRQPLEVDRVHDAGARRMHAHALERARRPFHEAVALDVALDLALHVARQARRASRSGRRRRNGRRDTSTGSTGLRSDGSPPASARRRRMAAMSTSAGTQVVSCISTRLGLNAISAVLVAVRSQSRNAPSVEVATCATSWRSEFSIENPEHPRKGAEIRTDRLRQICNDETSTTNVQRVRRGRIHASRLLNCMLHVANALLIAFCQCIIKTMLERRRALFRCTGATWCLAQTKLAP